MTYDLVVFDPRRKLRNRSKFLQWLQARTRWEDDLDFNDPRHAPRALQSWYEEMIGVFPPKYGRAAVESGDPAAHADYGIGRDLIYVGFDPHCSSLAYDTVHRLAAKHGVGLFDVDRGEAWFPGPRHTLEIGHGAPRISDSGSTSSIPTVSPGSIIVSSSAVTPAP